MMKFITILLMGFILISITGCGTIEGSESPALATGEFFIAVKANNFEEARKFLTDDANNMYTETDLEYYNTIFAADKGEFRNGVCFPEKDSVKITGDTATELIYWTDNIRSKTIGVSLTKKNGGWKIGSLTD